MDEDVPPPPKPVKLKKDGTPDRRGHSEGSKDTRFAENDGRRRPGRPKGGISMRRAYVEAASMTAFYYDKDGNRHSVPTLKGIALKQREKALKGDDKAVRRFEERVAEYCPDPVDPLSTAKPRTPRSSRAPSRAASCPPPPTKKETNHHDRA